MNQNARRSIPILLVITLVCTARYEGRSVGKQIFLPRLTSEFFRTAPEPDGEVRDELIRKQAQDGLTIAWYDPDGPEIVKFDKRAVVRGRRFAGQLVGPGAISRDGTQIAFDLHYEPGRVATLGIMQADGSNVREFSNVTQPAEMCWSYDMSRVALATVGRESSAFKLKMLELGSKSARDIAAAERITSQCWSPDGKEIVFESGGKVVIQDVEAGKSQVLAVGTGPTWSPDGIWIAYLDEREHNFYVIHPTGEGRKKLFHSRNGMAGLYWSPDARIVAYVVEEGFFLIDVETYRLRVRRLEDGSDDWVANEDIGCCENLQWVTSKALIAQIESAHVAQ